MAYQRSLSTGSFTRSRSRPVNSITPTAYTGDNLHEQSPGQLRTRAGDFMDVQFLEAGMWLLSMVRRRSMREGQRRHNVVEGKE